jgi:hypothetical protein
VSVSAAEHGRPSTRCRSAPNGAGRHSQRTERAQGTWIDPAGATIAFADWAQHWLDTDTAQTGTAKATDRSLLRSAILPTLGHRQLGSITSTEVQRLGRYR